MNRQELLDELTSVDSLKLIARSLTKSIDRNKKMGVEFASSNIENNEELASVCNDTVIKYSKLYDIVNTLLG